MYIYVHVIFLNIILSYPRPQFARWADGCHTQAWHSALSASLTASRHRYCVCMCSCVCVCVKFAVCRGVCERYITISHIIDLFATQVSCAWVSIYLRKYVWVCVINFHIARYLTFCKPYSIDSQIVRVRLCAAAHMCVCVWHTNNIIFYLMICPAMQAQIIAKP